MNKQYIRETVQKYRLFQKVIDLLYTIESFNKTVDLFEIFWDFTKEYNTLVLSILTIIRDRKFNSITGIFNSELLLKEVNKLYEYNQEYYGKISEILISKIEEYGDIVFSNRELIVKENESNFNEKLDMIRYLYEKEIFATSIMSDMYLLSRMLKSDIYINCIVYVGKAHYFTIKECLLSMGFELKNELFGDENNFRCIKNIIPFDEFFKNKYNEL